MHLTGGEVGGASSLGPKIVPLGLSPRYDIAKETTKDWTSLRVMVKLIVQHHEIL